jgi:hypothetical protein
MSSEIDWESGLGLPTEALEDDIKGMDELSLTSKLVKVMQSLPDRRRRTTKFKGLRLMKLLMILPKLFIYSSNIVLIIIRVGAPIQKVSVLNSLENLMKDRPNDTQVLMELYVL